MDFHLYLLSLYSPISAIVPIAPKKGAILGPLLFNINSIDIFYECEDSDIGNYAYDTTPYTGAPDINTVIIKICRVQPSKFTLRYVIFL